MNLGKFSFSAELDEVKRFQDLDDCEKEIVFYSENKNSIFIFESLIEELITKYDKNICYVTSSKDELNFKNKKIKTFFIGDGIARTKFFLNLKTKILIMTMPDLETFHIKKSKIYPVHYVYIFHAMVSTHLVYLKPNKLFHSGYTHLDNLIKKNAEKKDKITKDNNQILIAPSWGETGLFETVIEEVIRELLDAKYKVILRPHPMTLKLSKKKITLIQKLFSTNPDFKLELDLPNFDSLLCSDIMISDWSGIALEFAFAFEKPILYIDVPKKIHNKDFKDISQIPIEESIRDKIGKIILPSEIKQISKEIEMLKQQTFERKDMIRKIRDKEIFNIGNSGKKSASDIIELLNQLK